MNPDGSPIAPAPADTPPANPAPTPDGGTPPANPAPDPTPAPTPAPAPADPANPAPAVPPADPANPAPANPDATPGAPTPPGFDDDSDPTIADLTGDVPPDELGDAINALPNGQVPGGGVNPDGTIDPLIYAYDAIPDIEVRGKVGNGKIETYTIRTVDDLPDGFKWADGKEQTIGLAKINDNLDLAKQAITEANAHNQQRQAFIAKRDVMVGQKTEIEALAESGKLPKIGVKPGDEGFDKDPGVIRANQVLSHIAEVNKDFADRGINQKITSVEAGLMLLEAKEALEAKGQRMGTIQQTRNELNGGVNPGGGGGAPVGQPTGGGQQRVYKSVDAAIEAGMRREGVGKPQ